MKIKRMLPFLDKKELDTLMEACANNEISDEDFSPRYLLPFLSQEQTDRLFQMALEGKIAVRPKEVLPFLEDAVLDRLVESLREKEYDNLCLDDLLPYLNDDQIKKLFQEILEKAKNGKEE